jgi:hypothetical protein
LIPNFGRRQAIVGKHKKNPNEQGLNIIEVCSDNALIGKHIKEAEFDHTPAHSTPNNAFQED